MPIPIGLPQRAQRPPSGPALRKWLFIIIGIFIAIALGGQTWLKYYVDSLWFGSLGYAEVFWKTVRLQGTTFMGFAAATFLILYGSFRALKRAHLADLPGSRMIYVGGQPVNLP